jgi:ubiquinone/menaquinone biosynthesis C-methylase UbiE
MTSTTAPPVSSERLEEFVMRAVGELGAAVGAALVVTGDRLGLYRELAASGPLTSGELAARTGTRERYVREWLHAQAAGGYVAYRPEDQRFELPPEQAVALADETSPAFLPGAFQLALGAVRDEPAIRARFTSGHGMGWHEHGEDVFAGCERFFRPGYAAHLVDEWIPALDGVEAKLQAGARVADVGCGHAASAILLAQAYPRTRVDGFDYHDASIAEARRRVTAAGLDGRVTLTRAAAEVFPGADYDLVTCFDCLHDMADPVGAARHIRRALAPGGRWLIVEPFANDRLEDNLTPVGRVYYAFSTLLCTPSALTREDSPALGAQAGEARLREVILAGGFTQVRRVAETPFNLVLEAR